MFRNTQPTERPEQFSLNRLHPLAGSLVFAGLGGIGFGSTLYRDSSMCRLDGTLSGFTGAGYTPADRWGRALGRNCLSFPYPYGTIAFARNPATTTDWTVCAWIKAASFLNQFPSIFCWNYHGLMLEYNTLRVMQGNQSLASSGTIATGVWTHICGGYANGSRFCYINGQSQSLSSVDNGYAASGTTIGANMNGTLAPMLDASLADVTAWNAALPASAIARLADPSNVMLDTGGGQRLIQSPRRRSFAVAKTSRRRRLICCGD